MTPPSEQQLALPLEPPPPPKIQLPELWTPDDIFEAASQSVIMLFDEDNRVERKSARVEAKDVAVYLSVFGNSQPHGGIIFVGVEKNGEITGCRRISHEQLQKLHKIGDYCGDSRYECKKVEVRNVDANLDFVLAIRVYYRSDKLVEMNDGDAYVRHGDSKRRLTEQEKREIRISKGEIDYEQEDVSLKYPDDFDSILIKEFCFSFISKRGLGGDHSPEDILTLNHLGRFDRRLFKPNLACSILFGRDPRSIVPGARIRFMRFEGTEERTGNKYNVVKDELIDGPLVRQIQQADRLVQTQMRDFTRLGRDGRFYTNAEYPRDAWLEAVVNACVHRSYNYRNMVVFVKMFNDRFVVESPGGFPPLLMPRISTSRIIREILL